MLTVNIKASSRYPIKRKGIKQIISQVLSKMKIEGDIEIEVEIVGDRKMTQLHIDFMHESGTTDVLSFPLYDNFLKNQEKVKAEFIDLPDNIIRLGSIIISYPQTQRQANDHNLTVDNEINRLVEHGMLHLLGIHHE